MIGAVGTCAGPRPIGAVRPDFGLSTGVCVVNCEFVVRARVLLAGGSAGVGGGRP